MIITAIIFVICIFLVIISSFFVGINGLYVKRTVINIPFAIFEESIHETTYDNESLMVFDLNVIEVGVKTYLDYALKDKCLSYKFKIWPFKYNEENVAVYNDNFEIVEHFQLHFKGYYFKSNYVETYTSYKIIEKSVSNE